MKKVLFSGILMLSVNFAFANSNATEVSFANKNLKEATISHKTIAKNQISNAEDDSLFCEGVGWAAGAAARKLGASKNVAKMVAIAAEAACEGWFD